MHAYLVAAETNCCTQSRVLGCIVRAHCVACGGPLKNTQWNIMTTGKMISWASVALLPRDWNRRAGRPRLTWLRTVESDLAPFNIGLATAYHRAQNRQAWSKLVRTATSSSGQATWWWWWWWWARMATKSCHCGAFTFIVHIRHPRLYAS